MAEPLERLTRRAKRGKFFLLRVNGNVMDGRFTSGREYIDTILKATPDSGVIPAGVRTGPNVVAGLGNYNVDHVGYDFGEEKHTEIT